MHHLAEYLIKHFRAEANTIDSVIAAKPGYINAVDEFWQDRAEAYRSLAKRVERGDSIHELASYHEPMRDALLMIVTSDKSEIACIREDAAAIMRDVIGKKQDYKRALK